MKLKPARSVAAPNLMSRGTGNCSWGSMKPTEGSVKDCVDWGESDLGIEDFSLDSGLRNFALALRRLDTPNMPAHVLMDFMRVRRSLFKKCFLAIRKITASDCDPGGASGSIRAIRGKN